VAIPLADGTSVCEAEYNEETDEVADGDEEEGRALRVAVLESAEALAEREPTGERDGGALPAALPDAAADELGALDNDGQADNVAHGVTDDDAAGDVEGRAEGRALTDRERGAEGERVGGAEALGEGEGEGTPPSAKNSPASVPK
jgi:hypothetical protein